MNDDLRARADAVEDAVGEDDRPIVAYRAEGALLDTDGDPVPSDVSPIIVLPPEVLSTWDSVDLPDEVGR